MGNGGVWMLVRSVISVSVLLWIALDMRRHWHQHEDKSRKKRAVLGFVLAAAMIGWALEFQALFTYGMLAFALGNLRWMRVP